MLTTEQIRAKFRYRHTRLIYSENRFRYFLYELLVHGNAYVVGGYFRDILHDRVPRDIDIIVEHEHSLLVKIIKDNGLTYTINRHNGIKIQISELSVDIWSFENNWAFKNELVVLNENDKLNSIAKGCFYNYDSIVVSLSNYRFNMRHYLSFIRNNELDILQKRPSYKMLNPTIEANILRSFYVQKRFNSTFSENLKSYLISRIGFLRDNYEDPVERLNAIKRNYPKYDFTLSDQEVKNSVDWLIRNWKMNDLFFRK